MFGRSCQTQNSVDLIAYVAEAPRLAAIAIDGKVLSTQRLPHEVWNYAAVVDLHARSVGIEDAQNSGIDLVVTAKGHGDGFGKALGLVVYRSRADRIHISPVGFG